MPSGSCAVAPSVSFSSGGCLRRARPTPPVCRSCRGWEGACRGGGAPGSATQHRSTWRSARAAGGAAARAQRRELRGCPRRRHREQVELRARHLVAAEPSRRAAEPSCRAAERRGPGTVPGAGLQPPCGARARSMHCGAHCALATRPARAQCAPPARPLPPTAQCVPYCRPRPRLTRAPLLAPSAERRQWWRSACTQAHSTLCLHLTEGGEVLCGAHGEVTVRAVGAPSAAEPEPEPLLLPPTPAMCRVALRLDHGTRAAARSNAPVGSA